MLNSVHVNLVGMALRRLTRSQAMLRHAHVDSKASGQGPVTFLDASKELPASSWPLLPPVLPQVSHQRQQSTSFFQPAVGQGQQAAPATLVDPVTHQPAPPAPTAPAESHWGTRPYPPGMLHLVYEGVAYTLCIPSWCGCNAAVQQGGTQLAATERC